jgi:glutamate 5-kinase
MQRNLPVRPRRIIVKLGTGILTTKNYHLNKVRIKNIVSQIAALIERDIQVILVTSGAIGAGMGLLGLSSRPKLLPKQQAAAAVGQSHLMKVYNAFFKQHNLLSAQILLTRDDLSNRKRYLNARNTLLTLLDSKVIPIINENDTVAVDEIKFGDNDKLSALIANLLKADLLIILSDVDGLLNSKRSVISVVEKIVPDIERHVIKGKSARGTGGMISKLEAAKVCAAAGIACIVANGKVPGILLKLLDKEDMGTLFLPR